MARTVVDVWFGGTVEYRDVTNVVVENGTLSFNKGILRYRYGPSTNWHTAERLLEQKDEPKNFRMYGDSGTIHGTQHLNVEIGPDGNVCAVWYRCQMLPFDQTRVDQERAKDMSGVTPEYKPAILALKLAIPPSPER